MYANRTRKIRLYKNKELNTNYASLDEKIDWDFLFSKFAKPI